MVICTNIQAPLGTSLKSLVKGFILTKQTENKSRSTVAITAQSADYPTKLWLTILKAALALPKLQQIALVQTVTPVLKQPKPKDKDNG